MVKARRILLATLGGLGLVFLIVGLVLGGVYAEQSRGMVAVSGTITGFSNGDPMITYTWNGVTNTVAGHVSTSWQKQGDLYDLMVDPEQPERSVDGALPIVRLVFLLIGGVMLIAGIVTFLCMKGVADRRQALLGYGRQAEAVVTDISRNLVTRVNGRHPWVITASCVHPDTGSAVTIRRTLLTEPTMAVGDRLTVAFDPMNDKRYAIVQLDGEDG